MVSAHNLAFGKDNLLTEYIGKEGSNAWFAYLNTVSKAVTSREGRKYFDAIFLMSGIFVKELRNIYEIQIRPFVAAAKQQEGTRDYADVNMMINLDSLGNAVVALVKQFYEPWQQLKSDIEQSYLLTDIEQYILPQIIDFLLVTLEKLPRDLNRLKQGLKK